MDANEYRHTAWIGMAQPEGLVVTASALKAAEANITWPVTELQAALGDLAGDGHTVFDVRGFVRELLEWSDEYVAEGDLPDSLRVPLDGGELLQPSFALRSADEPDSFVILVWATKPGVELDTATDDKRWTATAHQRFERLLRETGNAIGLLTNGKSFRLVYAPKGESAGWVTFHVADMLSVDGRPLLGALHMLLNERRLLALEESKRLPGLLKASREYQNTVSNALREQVLGALRELLLGFQYADRLAGEAILRDYRGEHRQEVYKGLVTVLMRMVFVLYAEERGLLPMESDLYASSYSLTRLYAQLLEDRNRHGDGVDDRYGAWARVISLFRMLHDGARAADGLRVPPRKGDFFDPDAYPFLEGRPRGDVRQLGQTLDLPRVSDGVLFRVLDKLLVLSGERLQYKGLDVEQVGSVYEGLMGFELEIATGASLCVMPDHVVVDLDALLAVPGAERVKRLKELAGLDLKDKMAGEVRSAKTVEALQGALARRTSSRQPGLIGPGSLFLQPGQERRRTGSHYTPRSLTQPIVETTLRPVLDRLGPDVTPDQILDLKICDPAMGSGAFLVEACRQLSDHLVAAWRRTGTMPDLPADEDPLLHARRLIAQRCLYGVDKNPLAVDLARLSLWLVTFAKEHPFTFVDHALRHGDSLVGLSREQTYNLSLDPAKGYKLADQVRNQLYTRVKEAERLRLEIHAIGDPPDTKKLEELWKEAEAALDVVRLVGDAVVASFFSESTDKARKKRLEDLWMKVPAWLHAGEYEAELRGLAADLHGGERPVPAFHWEVEFPEVFSRENPGFDCFVGNPPFLGGTRISAMLGMQYFAYLVARFPPAQHHCDLVAYFFRVAFWQLRQRGAFGFLATKTIAQGDTRSGGLAPICASDGTIYAARRRFRWPGLAAVRVSVVHVTKGLVPGPFALDGKAVDRITAFLFHRGGSDDPARLAGRNELFSVGSKIYGQGFLFADDDEKATRLSELEQILKHSPHCRERVFPYLGGPELNHHPEHKPNRQVIDVNAFEEDEIRRRWPELMTIIENRVKPERDVLGDNPNNIPLRKRWWAYQAHRPELYRRLGALTRTLVCTQTSKHRTFTFVPSRLVFDQKLVVIALDDFPSLAVLHSRVHEDWALFFGSTMKDDPVYTPSDCFETFAFPHDYGSNSALEESASVYYDHRAALMLANNEGLTKTYNRFHDPDETQPGILKLRELHAEMDRAVLDAYGWTDIQPVYDFREQLDESIRLTWDDDTRDEVLARLLELNRVIAEKERAEAEAEAPAKSKRGNGAGSKKKPRKKKGTAEESTLSLLPGEDE